MADAAGLEVEVLDTKRLTELKMGALLGVAQGSSEPPVLIVVRYRPESKSPSTTHLGLVGKAVTFDTGGISLKPSADMDQMKYDMAGGAATLGAMQAIAHRKAADPRHRRDSFRRKHAGIPSPASRGRGHDHVGQDSRGAQYRR